MNTRSMLLIFFFFFLILCPLFQTKESRNRPVSIFKNFSSFLPANNARSSAVIPLSGNVYPLGYYSVSLRIGNPPKSFDFDIDTGSDITWVQCDAPCISCNVPPERQYKPHKNTIPCSDPLCSALHWPQKPQCKNPNDQCDYDVDYADHSSSMGALVIDQFPLSLKSGSSPQPHLAFGCGYDQQFPSEHPTPVTAGVLGLGRGRIGVPTQLSNLGLTRNVIGHCLSPQGGGFLFFGGDLVPSSGVSWTPMSLGSPSNKHYMAGPAELLFNGKPTGLKALNLILDSASSYTYFDGKTYQTIVNQIKIDLKGKPLNDYEEDKTLPVCWKSTKPLKSVLDVKNYFKTLTISFLKSKSVQLQIPPESYLIISKRGNVCLGILNGTEAGLQDLNVIGDIFMQGIMVIYDNEKQQLGWVSADCNKIP